MVQGEGDNSGGGGKLTPSHLLDAATLALQTSNLAFRTKAKSETLVEIGNMLRNGTVVDKPIIVDIEVGNVLAAALIKRFYQGTTNMGHVFERGLDTTVYEERDWQEFVDTARGGKKRSGMRIFHLPSVDFVMDFGTQPSKNARYFISKPHSDGLIRKLYGEPSFGK